MTSAETWNLNSNFVEESETGLEIEAWMTRQETWNIKNAEAETELAVEGWMINESIWN